MSAKETVFTSQKCFLSICGDISQNLQLERCLRSFKRKSLKWKDRVCNYEQKKATTALVREKQRVVSARSLIFFTGLRHCVGCCVMIETFFRKRMQINC